MTERKSLPLAEFKVLDVDEGIVETLVAVSGIEDKVKDVIEPGALGKSLESTTPVGVWSHDWDRPVSKVIEAKEIMPGGEGLPETKADGTPWPEAGGALYIKAQYNLETQEGRDAFSWAKFLGADQQWSIGYRVPAGGSETKKETGVRHIKAIDVLEYSQVIHGAMPITRSLTVKSLEDVFGDEEIADEEYAEQRKAFEETVMNEEMTAETEEVVEEIVETEEVVEEIVETEEAEKGLDINEIAAAIVGALGEEAKSEDVAAAVERAMLARDGVKSVEVIETAATETKVFAHVAGSWEAILTAVNAELKAQKADLFGEAGYCNIVASFDDRIIVEIYTEGDEKSYELSYEMGDEGVTFGEPTPVKLSAVVSEKADFDALVDELKAGRDQHAADVASLRGVVDTLMKTLAAAGIEVIEEEKTEEVAEEIVETEEVEEIVETEEVTEEIVEAEEAEKSVERITVSLDDLDEITRWKLLNR